MHKQTLWYRIMIVIVIVFTVEGEWAHNYKSLAANKLDLGGKKKLIRSVYLYVHHAGQISSVPRTETSYLNSQVCFTCTVEAPWILTWEVDGTAARYLSARNVTFNTITTREVETSTLYIMASSVNNNSEIACVPVSANGQEIGRAVAFLYIQGSY
jgi:hypothetical protein